MVTISVKTRAGQYLKQGVEVEGSNEDFEVIEAEVLESGKIATIEYYRASDGQQGYWTPQGVSLRQYYWNAGQPKKPEAERKVPTSLKLDPKVKGWLDSQARSNASLIEEAVIEHYGLKDPASENNG